MTVTGIEKAYSGVLGDFAADLRYEDVPEDVVEKAKLHVLDTLGIAVATHGMDFAEMMLGVARGFRGVRQSTAVGSGEKLPAPLAALVNGTMAHGLDYDDTHRTSGVHASAFAVPAAVAVAEARGKRGKDVLTAVVTGYEISARLGMVASGKFLARGWHPTSVLGTFASSVVASRVMGLSGDQMATAMGIAGSQASGLAQWLDEGSWTKRMHPGWAEHSGIMAALLAEQGYSSPSKILEGRRGLYNVFLANEEFDYDQLTHGLGSVWETKQFCYKMYPSGY